MKSFGNWGWLLLPSITVQKLEKVHIPWLWWIFQKISNLCCMLAIIRWGLNSFVLRNTDLMINKSLSWMWNVESHHVLAYIVWPLADTPLVLIVNLLPCSSCIYILRFFHTQKKPGTFWRLQTSHHPQWRWTDVTSSCMRSLSGGKKNYHLFSGCLTIDVHWHARIIFSKC